MTASPSTLAKKTDIAPWSADPNHKDAGWKFSTKVTSSNIADAGRGRFVLEPVKEGQVLRQIKGFWDAHRGPPPQVGMTVKFENREELDAYLDQHESDKVSRKEMLTYLSNYCFCYEFFPEGTAYVHVGAAVVNHPPPGVNPNVSTRIGKEGKYECYALTDIQPGDELYASYRRYHLPGWFKNLMAENGLMDVEDFFHYHLSGTVSATL